MSIAMKTLQQLKLLKLQLRLVSSHRDVLRQLSSILQIKPFRLEFPVNFQISAIAIF